MLIPTPAADAYLRLVGMWLKAWRSRTGFQPIGTYRYVELWFVLPMVTCDVHNYGKTLFDALEDGGIVTNDKYILPVYRGVWHDAKHPEVIIQL